MNAFATTALREQAEKPIQNPRAPEA